MIAFLGALVVRTLHATLRVKHVRAERIESLPQYIIAFWHAHMAMMLHSRYRRPISVLSSQSKDGDIAVSIYQRFGVTAYRGSSTRGGTAGLRELIRAARNGSNIVFTPDGPKGPPRIVKSGVVFTAQATGLPIMPIAFAAKKKSSCGRGTVWSCRIHSPRPTSCTATRSRCHATATSRSGA